MTTREPSRAADRCRIWNLDHGPWSRSPETAQETPLSTKRVRPPPTIGVMPGFFENGDFWPDSGDPGAKPGSEQPMPASGRLSAVRTSSLSVLDPCRSAAGSRLLIQTVSRTRSRTCTHAHAKMLPFL